MRSLAIIPARLNSTRLAEKPLIDINGKSMIQRVYEQVKKCKDINDVIIATDDLKIYKHVESFKGYVMMTRNTHISGTERCNEVAEKLKKEYDLVINIQGDEPLMSHTVMNECASLLNDDSIDIGTLGSSFLNKEDWLNPNMVKVLVDHSECALYFSRSSIPYPRENEIGIIEGNIVLHHHGIYAYRCKSLRMLYGAKDSQIQIIEGLEQLKALYHGLKIKVGVASKRPGPSIDVAEDIDLVVKALQ